MKRLRNPALLLAALLQVFPICRTVCTCPGATSTLAIIMRWTVGALAALGAYDSVSGGTQVYFDSPGTAVGTVGVPFIYYITLGGKVSGDPGSVVAAAPLPGGLTNYTVEHLTSPLEDWGVITGTPTNAMTNVLINLAASNPNFNAGAPVTGSLFLTVVPTSTPIVITSNPTNIIANNGQNVTFGAVVTGTGPYHYQWYYGDTNIFNHIPDATNSNYSFKATNAVIIAAGKTNVYYNSGNYQVRIAGASGMIASQVATLIVNTPSLAISSPPTNLNVNVGDTAAFAVTAAGTSTMGYQWYKSGTIRISGATSSSYSISNVQASNAGNFTVVVTNTSGSLTSSIAALSVNAVGVAAPVITNQPVGLTNVAGSSPSFSVIAGGAAPIAYQWRWNATNNLLNATNSFLTLTNARVSQAGDYSVVINNNAGSVTSSPAKLVVTIPPSPLVLSPAQSGNSFVFSFVPVVGLTNSVVATASLNGSSWNLVTNIPPPTSSSPITVIDPFTGLSRFYRVTFAP